MHDPETKQFMRAQAIQQHVKNMNELVKMVEHVTVQNCSLQWPGLHTPKDASFEDKGDAAPELGRTRGRSKVKLKMEMGEADQGHKQATPQQKKKRPGRKANTRVNKPKAAPCERVSRASKAKMQRELDTQPDVNLLPIPETHSSSYSKPEMPPSPPKDQFSSPMSSQASILSEASTQAMREMNKATEAHIKDIKEASTRDIEALSKELAAVKLEKDSAMSDRAHYKALYDDALKARDEWKEMVLRLLPGQALPSSR